MFRKEMSSKAARLFLGSALLLWPAMVAAQRHGGGGFGGGIPGATSRPTGLDEKDPLAGFHHALAVQATSEQVSEFQVLVKETDAAKSILQTFVEQQRKTAASSARPVTGTEIDQSLQQSRADSHKFIEGFSEPQKSGLKELLKKLSKADSDVEADTKKLDDTLQSANTLSAEVASRGEVLTKSLTDFSDQQLALGREMGVVLAQGSDLTFNLPEVRSPVTVGDQSIAVTSSGELSQVSSQGAQRSFKLQMVSDLSDLQQNITEFLRAQLDGGRVCGERLSVRNAAITPAEPASILVLQLHYERWACIRIAGQSGPQELAEGDGSVDVKITPVIHKADSLDVTAEFSRIDAEGVMADSLRSGDFGQELRHKIAHAIFSVVQGGANLQKSLPPAVQNLATVKSAKFEDISVGKLGLVVEGELAASDQQVNLMASQLNQATFARTAPPQETPNSMANH